MKSIYDHLKERHLNFEIHRPIISEENRTATFFLYNLSGQITGYQQYKPDEKKFNYNDPKSGRYFTYRSDSYSVFGLESFHLSPKLLFITEGIFDAARITNKGCSAIAVLSNNPPKDLKNFLFSINRKIIAICDNDSAGKKLTNFCHEAIFTQDKDLGESSEEFVDDVLKKF